MFPSPMGSGMTMRTLICLLVIAGCAGEAPATVPGVDAGDVDAAPEGGQRVSGKALDYFVADTPLANATITTDGIEAVAMAQSGIDGAYEVANIPAGSKLFLAVARANYRTTRNIAVSIEDAPVTRDVYVMSVADVNRQYATDGKPVNVGKAFLAADLKDAAGIPLAGIPLANVKLTDLNDQPVPALIGPYFFGAQGDINPALTTAEANAGRSRVAFLDVPPGTFKLSVTYPDGQGGNATSVTQVIATAGGAVIANGGGVIPGAAAADPTFATNIYPRLQKAANDGLGCANCHTANGSGGILVMNAGAATTLANIMARPGAINTAAPAESLLLTKPLYEPAPAVQNHPNATFLDANDPDYKLFLRWITNGAKP